MTSVGPTDVARYREDRRNLIADGSLDGAGLRRGLCALTDAWLRSVFAHALAERGATEVDLGLVALGGYGRGELLPGSDLDLLVVHRGSADQAEAVAEATWYPIWDAGVALGHSVRSLSEATRIVGGDVESATAMLDARLLAGDEALVAELREGVGEAWRAGLPAAIEWLRADAASRRERFGDVAFAVEPHLKAGAGGLRDAQVPGWIERAGPVLDEADRTTLRDAASVLSDVRTALHRRRPSSGEVLRLEDQDDVAEALGVADADELMTDVAHAARSVAWVSDELWEQFPSARRSRGAGRGDRGAADERRGDLSDPLVVLELAADQARRGDRFDRATLGAIAQRMRPLGDPWPPGGRVAFLDLLRAGPGAIDVIEALDHVGAWSRILPEWDGVRSQPQRTTHHTYTVDRHLLETVAIASTLTDRVDRPDLLVLGALLHDLGKGQGGDHSVIGVELARRFGTRLGLDREDVAVLENLVRHHLLLPEVATRRDLGDARTIDLVAGAVGSVEVLALLLALTEADARATGPTAWTEWKAGLVRTLAERAALRLQGDSADQYGPVFPSVEQMLLLRAGVTTVRGDGTTLTVVAPDRPGLFARVAGALVLHGLNVLHAAATTSDGLALEEFTVASAFASQDLSSSVVIDWPKVVHDVEQAMAGRLAIEARVAERAVTYRRRSLSADTEVRVRFDDSVGDATVLEVDAPDAVGLLYRVTRALADLEVDIRLAKVETLTDRVVDAFTLTAADGSLLDSPEFRSEVERAVRHAASR